MNITPDAGTDEAGFVQIFAYGNNRSATLFQVVETNIPYCAPAKADRNIS